MKIALKIALVSSLLAVGFLIQVVAQQTGPLLDPEVEVVAFAGLDYPPLARQARIEGAVVVRATLDGQGKVIDATALSGLPVFVPSCLANIKGWQFKIETRKTAVVIYNFRILAGRCEPMNQTSLVRNLVVVTSCQGPTQVSNSR